MDERYVVEIERENEFVDEIRRQYGIGTTIKNRKVTKSKGRSKMKTATKMKS